MILYIFISIAAIQVIFGSYTIGRLLEKRYKYKDMPISLMFTFAIVAIFVGLMSTIDNRFSGRIPSSAIKGVTVFLCALFFILSLSFASLLSNLAGKIERKKKMSRLLKVSISIILSLWLSISAAFAAGFTKSIFYNAGHSIYSVQDAGYGYLGKWKSDALANARDSFQACDESARMMSQHTGLIEFRRREQSVGGMITSGAVFFDAYENGRPIDSLKMVRRVTSQRRNPRPAVEHLVFDTRDGGRCAVDAAPLRFVEGVEIPSSQIEELFRGARENIQGNIELEGQRPVPWYAIGASQTLSELNINLLEIKSANEFSSNLDEIIYWFSKLFWIYIIAFFAMRIRRDLYD